VLWCLPQARVDTSSESPGTVIRTADFRRIAAQAGWAEQAKPRKIVIGRAGDD
jgi:hypothetical protein